MFKFFKRSDKFKHHANRVNSAPKRQSGQRYTQAEQIAYSRGWLNSAQESTNIGVYNSANEDQRDTLKHGQDLIRSGKNTKNWDKVKEGQRINKQIRKNIFGGR